MASGPRRWCAPFRAGTTPATPPRAPSPSSPPRWTRRRFARIDAEEFYDFQANRPRSSFDEGSATREIVWPTVEVFEARAPRAPRDLVLVQGVEPSMRWRAFSALIVDLAEALGVQLVVTLGALLADVPHTRPVAMTGLASDPALIERLGLRAARATRGRRGSSACCTAPAQDAGLPSASLWASVPHYVAAATNPKAALALVRRLEGLVGVSVDVSELESAAADYERQVGLAVQSDPDIQAFVERLEQAAESEERGASPEDVPSGDMLAREFQRFLRQRGPDEQVGQQARAGATVAMLGRRADDPVVADRAGRVRGRRLELLREDPLADLEHASRDRLGVALAARHGHLVVVEHVVVGLPRGLQLPGLARGERIERELDVVAAAARRSSGARSCSRSARTRRPSPPGEAVDAVDAPAQLMRAEPEGERALEPHRLGVLAGSRAW